MYPAGATWGFRTRAELDEAGARTLLDRPADLLLILDGVG
jgi:phosphoglycolate phosphatase-like HAD superfamily hydrolase